MCQGRCCPQADQSICWSCLLLMSARQRERENESMRILSSSISDQRWLERKIPMQEQTCRCWPKAVPMLVLFSRVSTWLFVELLATAILLVLNMFIPLLMVFSSYRNVINFYFSSVALSSSMINCLYMFYLAQTLHSKALSENNCRAIYYLQTSCIVVLGRCSIGADLDLLSNRLGEEYQGSIRVLTKIIMSSAWCLEIRSY